MPFYVTDIGSIPIPELELTINSNYGIGYLKKNGIEIDKFRIKFVSKIIKSTN